MLSVKLEPGFVRDVKALKKKHRDMDLLKRVMEMIATDTTETQLDLASRYADHALTGDKKGNRECHLDDRQDWLLGYAIDREIGQVIFVMSGSHDYLYGKTSRMVRRA